MNVTVKHVGSSPLWDKPKDGSANWIEYWRKYTTYRFPLFYCPDCGALITSNNPLVGAHVKKVGSTDQDIYIVPTCKSCNTKGASDHHSFVCDSSLLVPANKNKL